MGDHIVDNEFQSDKYPSCPRGKVPLSVGDPTAQDLLWIYAQRRRSVDAEFSEDLETCLRAKGFRPGPSEASRTPASTAVVTVALERLVPVALESLVRQHITTAFLAGVEYGVGWLDSAPAAEIEAVQHSEEALAAIRTAAPVVLNTGERENLLEVRRLVANTAKSCSPSHREGYRGQLALLDRLLETSPGTSTPVS